MTNHAPMTAYEAQLRAELGEANDRADRWRAKYERDMATMRECWEDAQRVANQRLVELNAVRAHADNVWFWQGGGDRPDSLSCPVVMTADALRSFIVDRDSARAECERMRPVFEAALKWRATPPTDAPVAEGGKHVCMGPRAHQPRTSH